MARLKVKHAPRSQDELILRWLALRCSGDTLAKIRDIAGAGNNRETINTMMVRVRKADIAEGPAYWGDDPQEIERSYWK